MGKSLPGRRRTAPALGWELGAGGGARRARQRGRTGAAWLSGRPAEPECRRCPVVPTDPALAGALRSGRALPRPCALRAAPRAGLRGRRAPSL